MYVSKKPTAMDTKADHTCKSQFNFARYAAQTPLLNGKTGHRRIDKKTEIQAQCDAAMQAQKSACGRGKRGKRPSERAGKRALAADRRKHFSQRTTYARIHSA